MADASSKAGFCHQLCVLAKKNRILKKRQTCCLSACCADCELMEMKPTCCCFCCPYVPLLFETLLPLLLLVGLSQLKGQFEPAVVPSGWTNIPDGDSNDAQQPQQQYYHTADPIDLTFTSGQSGGVSSFSATAPMKRAMTILDLMLNYELYGISDDGDDGGVCRKIGLAGSSGVSASEVRAFQSWVDQDLLGWSKMNSTCEGDASFNGAPFHLKYTNFSRVSMVFESEDKMNDWITGPDYGQFQPTCDAHNSQSQPTSPAGTDGPVCSAACSACTDFSPSCQPQINLAIVFDKVAASGAGGVADWKYDVRINTTFAGFDALNTKRPPTDDISPRPTPGAAASYANSGFLTLQTLVQRYIVNERTSAFAEGTKNVDGRQQLYTNLYETGYFESFVSARSSSAASFTGRALLKAVVPTGLPPNPPRLTPCAEAVLEYVTNSETFFPNVLNYVAMPTYTYQYSTFYQIVEGTLPMLFILLFLLNVFLTHSAFLNEKETRMREMLKIMGVSNASLTLSWFMMYAIINLVIAIVFAAFTSATIFVNTNFVMLFFFYYFFLMSIISFAYFVTAWFSKSMTGAIGGTIAFLVGWIVATTIVQPTSTYLTKWRVCLLPAGAFTLGIQQITVFEQQDQGITPANASDFQQNFSFATALGMLFFDTIFYALAGAYFDQVLPQEFGTRQPVYFPFLPSYWCGGGSSTSGSSSSSYSGVEANGGAKGGDDVDVELGARANSGPDDTLSGNFEPVNDALRQQERDGTCVVIRNLRKVFNTPDGEKVAVQNLSLSMYKGQIFALLGHNGAGKTTTISMMCGLVEPTSGDATILGLSVRNQMPKIRSSLGWCPQHDVLYATLTVYEHLCIYAELKGMRGEVLEEEVMAKIRMVGLTEKVHVPSKALSGGMKRKLSVAISLLGDARMVFMDEPTSGMDPYSRRSTWDIIQSNREGRVIVLTTHFMDEADLLGDRIGIMAEGELRCCGSSLFLKNRFGAGYNLTIVKAEDASADRSDAIVQTVKRHAPSANVLSDVGAELTLQLPVSDSSTFAPLLRELERASASLQVVEYGLSVTTLEEVFIRVASMRGSAAEIARERAMSRQDSRRLSLSRSFLEAQGEGEGEGEGEGAGAGRASDVQARIERVGSNPLTENLVSGAGAGAGSAGAVPPGGGSGLAAGLKGDEGYKGFTPLTGFQRTQQQFMALLLKRAQYSRRAPMAQCCGVLCPAIALLIGLILITNASAALDNPAYPLNVGQFNPRAGDTPVPYVDPSGSAGAAFAFGGYKDAQFADVKSDKASAADFATWYAKDTDSSRKPVQWPADSIVQYVQGLGAGPIDSAREQFVSQDCLTKLASALSGGEAPKQCQESQYLVLDYVCGNPDLFAFMQQPPFSSPFGSISSVYAGLDPNGLCGFSGNPTDLTQACERFDINTSNPTVDPSKKTPTNPLGITALTCPEPSTATGVEPVGYPAHLLALVQTMFGQSDATANGKYARKASVYGSFVLPPGSTSSGGKPSTGAGIDAPVTTVIYNSSGTHTTPTYTNLLADLYYQRKTGGKGSIAVSSHPLPVTRQYRETIGRGLAFGASLIIMLAYGFIPAALVAFVVFERDDKHNSKHQQLLCGASVPMFWLANYTFDLLNYCFGGTLFNLFSRTYWRDTGMAIHRVRVDLQNGDIGLRNAMTQLLFQCIMLVPGPFLWAVIMIRAFNFSAFIEDGAYAAVVVLFLGYGFALAPFCYMLSFLFKTHSTAQIYSVLLAVFTGLLLMIAAFVMSLIKSTESANSSLMFVYFLFPPFCLGRGLFQIILGRNIDVAINSDSCLASAGDDQAAVAACFRPKPIWDVTVVGYPVIYMFCMPVLYFSIVLYLDMYALDRVDRAQLAAAEKAKRVAGGAGGQAAADAEEQAELDALEDDVRQETTRVQQEGAGGVYQIRLDRLRKTYAGGKKAVRGVSFGVKAGECFGFLGINGAGKTSTMKMLTADVTPTSGTGEILGHNIVTEQQACRAKMGYCPQFDALLDQLSVREHLELFAKIKGVPPSALEPVVVDMLTRMQLSKFERKLAGSLSGGNKRKLSVAIAMVGSPPVVFLDEPSTGMDPVARRWMWDIIQGMSTRSLESCVVLTTHSMEEAEALCSRVGIMVGGQLRCLGSCQHLKNKYGQGFMVELRLASDGPSDGAGSAHPTDVLTAQDISRLCSERGLPQRVNQIQEGVELHRQLVQSADASKKKEGTVSRRLFEQWWATEDAYDALMAFARAQFDDVQLLERHEELVRLRLNTDDGIAAGDGGGGADASTDVAAAKSGREMKLADVFEQIESAKAQLNIQEYSVTQTSLEQIFNQFAAQQEEEKGGAVGMIASPLAAGEVTVAVAVPPGVTAGQQLSIETSAGPMLITVPEGMLAGQQFNVTLPPGTVLGPAQPGSAGELPHTSMGETPSTSMGEMPSTSMPSTSTGEADANASRTTAAHSITEI